MIDELFGNEYINGVPLQEDQISDMKDFIQHYVAKSAPQSRTEVFNTTRGLTPISSKIFQQDEHIKKPENDLDTSQKENLQLKGNLKLTQNALALESKENSDFRRARTKF